MGTEIQLILRRHFAADADMYGMGGLRIIPTGTGNAAQDPNKGLVASLEA